jgi:hypothetical protein
VPGITGPVAAPVLIADGRGGERHHADDEQVVVLPPAHDSQDRGGGEHQADGPVVRTARPAVPWTALAGQRGGGPSGDRGQPREDVDRQHSQERGRR